MKKLLVGVAGLATICFAGSAMAAGPLANPWVNDGAEVGVQIEVGEIGEVFTTRGTNQARNGELLPELQITNAGGTIPPAGIAIDTLWHMANVNYQVSVELDTNNMGLTDIPEWSRFHVLVGVANRGSYNAVFAGLPGQVDVVADQVITWDRRDSTTGYLGNQPNVPIPLTTLLSTPSTSLRTTAVDYAADAINGLPPIGASTVELVYTIASI
jgi:hypothetical protein